MGEPEKEVKFFKSEKLTTIGLDQEAERREIQEAIHKSTGGKKVEIGIKMPSIRPPNIKPLQCPMVIPYYKVTLKGRKKQTIQPNNHQNNEESTESTEDQPNKTKKQKEKQNKMM